MATELQKKSFREKIVEYKKKYLVKENMELDESSTRLMINHFLSRVLDYKELEEIKTEYRIRDKYADYVIQLNKKKHFVVEVKSIDLDLVDKHASQGLNYAANEGIEWLLLTNGRSFNLYRVLFKKPIGMKMVFSFDLTKQKSDKMVDGLILLSKQSVLKKELNEYWERFQALDPTRLHKFLYKKSIVNGLKKQLKEKCDIRFSDEDILDSIHQVIINKIESEKPDAPTD